MTWSVPEAQIPSLALTVSIINIISSSFFIDDLSLAEWIHLLNIECLVVWHQLRVAMAHVMGTL